MKRTNCHKHLIIFSAALLTCFIALSQDSLKKELLVDVVYHMSPGRVPYLMVNTKTKLGKRFLPAARIAVNVYLDSVPAILGKVKTGEHGTARIDLPASAKSAWDASATHTFIATTEATKEFDEVTAQTSITKSKLLIDTVPDAETRSIRVRVMKLNDNEWLPAKEVELKLGVKRLGGELPIGEEESYTTDSTGEVIAEFKKVQLPGDTAGNLILVARVEDNELYGNLLAEAGVPWGIALKVTDTFNERTLWATRDKAPIWLLSAAVFIVVIVWGIIVFLVLQIFKIRKLGIAGLP
jgi:hypothetical protein